MAYGTVGSGYVFGEAPDKQQDFRSYIANLKNGLNSITINTTTDLAEADNYEVYNASELGTLVLRFTVTVRDDATGGTKTVTSFVKPQETENVGFSKDVIQSMVFDSVGDVATLSAALAAETDGVLNSADLAGLTQYTMGTTDVLEFRVKAVNG